MYRTICTELWSDPDIKPLTVPTKLLFLYLITNPHAHLSGIYYLSERTVIEETRLTAIPYRYGIDTLSSLGKVFRDVRTETFFVTNMFAYQGKGPKNDQAAAKQLRTLHHSSLIQRFLTRYPQILPLMSGYPIDTLSKLSHTDPAPVSSTDSVPDSELKSNGHTTAKGKTGVSEEWVLSETEAAQWKKFGINPYIEFAAFKDHALANDRRCKDWPAALRNWFRKSITMQEAKK